MVVTATTDKGKKPHPGGPSVTHTWEDFARVCPIYSALANQCSLDAGPYPAGVNPTQWANKEVRERDLLWLDELDAQVQAVNIRQLLAKHAESDARQASVPSGYRMCTRLPQVVT